MSTLNVITVRVREGIETKCLVVLFFKLGIHLLLLNSLLDIVFVLLLLGHFLFDLYFIQLVKLLLCLHISNSLLLNLLNTLFCLGIRSRLGLLHIFEHVVASIFISWLIEE